MNVCRIICEDQTPPDFGWCTLGGEDTILINWTLNGIDDPDTPKDELAVWVKSADDEFNGTLYWRDKYWFTYFEVSGIPGDCGGGHVFSPTDSIELNKCKKTFNKPIH